MSSCSSKERVAVSYLDETKNTELEIPSNMVFIVQNDTIDYNTNDCDFKIVNYVDSIGCSSCKMNLFEWEQILSELERDPNVTVKLLLIVRSDDIDIIKDTTKRYRFNYPIVIDNNGYLDSINIILNKFGTNTALLDDNNSILLLGNPYHDNELMDRYKETMNIHIGEEGNHSDSFVRYRPSAVSLGVFNIDEEKQSRFILENRTDSCIVISDIITSCNCTMAWTNSDTLHPHNTLPLFVLCKPDSTDHYFKRYITVSFTKNQPSLTLTVSGYVKPQNIQNLVSNN